jgi:hypothetical protein
MQVDAVDIKVARHTPGDEQRSDFMRGKHSGSLMFRGEEPENRNDAISQSDH